MEDLLKCQAEDGAMKKKQEEEQKKKEEEETKKKLDPEELHAQHITNLMESTLKPRGSVVAALISTNWDPEEAFMILVQEMIEPTNY